MAKLAQIEYAFGPDTPGPVRSWRPLVVSTENVVVAGHPLAAKAASDVLSEGGNAVDAGVAAGLVLAVVESPIVGFAGVAPSLYHDAKTGRTVISSGVGTWPRAASSAAFRDIHDGRIPKGVMRTVVPAAPHVWLRWLQSHGTITFSRAAEAAMRIADKGFILNPYIAHIIDSSQSVMADWPSSLEVFKPGGHIPQTGELFRQPDLAGSIALMCKAELASGGSRDDGLRAVHDVFYRGEIAAKIVGFYAEQGGFLTAEDMAAIDVPFEAPAMITFHGHHLLAGGIWGQGVSFLEALGILEQTDLADLKPNSANHIHLLAEVTKLVAADRDQFCGDPRFIGDATETLLSPDYLARRRARLNPDVALTWPQYEQGDSSSPQPGIGENQDLATTYLAVIDRHGNVFSATPSDGSRHGPVVPGTGLAPSGRGSTSTLRAGHPGEVAPGKRPRMMTGPVLARLADGRVMTFGSPGSDTQLQANLQFICNHLLFGMDMQTAVEMPRFSCFGFPGSFAPQSIKPQTLKVEADIPERVRADLRQRGHVVEEWASRAWMAGSVGAAMHDPAQGTFAAAADPRRMAYGIGG